MTARKIAVIMYSRLTRTPERTFTLSDYPLEYEQLPTSQSEKRLNRFRRSWRTSTNKSSKEN